MPLERNRCGVERAIYSNYKDFHTNKNNKCGALCFPYIEITLSRFGFH